MQHNGEHWAVPLVCCIQALALNSFHEHMQFEIRSLLNMYLPNNITSCTIS
nr:MAG TPA: hypothetical protein [Caudoviricetes sp.]